MSYAAQFGYPYHPASQLLVSGQSGSGNVGGGSSPCCESGRTVVTDPVTGQTVFACQQCDSHSLVYPRLGTSVQGGPYSPYSEQSYPPSVGIESPSFYPSLGTSYVLKEGSSEVSGWQSMAQPTGYYPYDHSITAYGYGYDINGARRKNATREATATLKAWLSEHKKNPYPTKGEKIMLAIITKMTLTQVSTWFANARRRLKKENKITWDSKGKEDEDDEDGGKCSDSDDEKDLRASPDAKMSESGSGEFDKNVKDEFERREDRLTNAGSCNHMATGSASVSAAPPGGPSAHHQLLRQLPAGAQSAAMSRYGLMAPSTADTAHSHDPTGTDMASGVGQQNRPKIWSLADTATSSSCKSLLPPSAPSRPTMQLHGSAMTTSSAPLDPTGPAAWTHNVTSGGAARPAAMSRLMYGEQEVDYDHFLKNYGNWHPGHATNSASHPTTAPSSNTFAHYQYNPHHQQQQQQQHHHHQATASSSHLPPPPPCELGPPSSSGQGGRAPPSSGGQCANGTSGLSAAELQTDTPPQTPPNHKFPSTTAGYSANAHNNNNSLVGHQVAKYSPADVYGGQRSLMSSVNSRLHDYQDDSSEAELSGNSQSLSSTGSTSQSANSAAFKPAYKSSLSNSGNLVIA